MPRDTRRRHELCRDSDAANMRDTRDDDDAIHRLFYAHQATRRDMPMRLFTIYLRSHADADDVIFAKTMPTISRGKAPQDAARKDDRRRSRRYRAKSDDTT